MAETNSKLEAVWFCDFTAGYRRNEDEYHQQNDTNGKSTVPQYVRSCNTLTFKKLDELKYRRIPKMTGPPKVTLIFALLLKAKSNGPPESNGLPKLTAF